MPVAKAINPSLTDDCVALIFSALRGIDADAGRFADGDAAAAAADSARAAEPVHEERLAAFLAGDFRSAGLSLEEFMRICTYVTLRFKRRRGRWGQVLVSEALCNCAPERPPRLCAARDPALQWAAREAVEREAVSFLFM